MAGTNAYRAKKALIDATRLWLSENAATHDVTVTYGYRGNQDFTELVHGGNVNGPQSYPVSGGGSARHKRDETLTIRLHAAVRVHGGDQEEVERRVVEIATVIMDQIAATASLPDFSPGEIISVGIAETDLDSYVDDDAATGVFAIDVAVNSRLA